MTTASPTSRRLPEMPAAPCETAQVGGRQTRLLLPSLCYYAGGEEHHCSSFAGGWAARCPPLGRARLPSPVRCVTPMGHPLSLRPSPCTGLRTPPWSSRSSATRRGPLPWGHPLGGATGCRWHRSATSAIGAPRLSCPSRGWACPRWPCAPVPPRCSKRCR